jgi:CheY-like chemotaxis protein/HPt (histidine-containing phosphotransfer) domain-containing protein
MRILVAEDTTESRELLVELLRNGGHTVVGVCNGREALDALEKDRFEVVFMDEQMPVMDGIEATHAIRKRSLAHGKRPIIIGMSGNTSEADERRCLDAGMDSFLPKPIGMAELLAMLAALARRPPQTAAGHAASPDHGGPPHDLAAHLHRATGGDEKLLRALLKNFLADAPKKIATLRRAIARKNADALASAAHALKGSLGLFGAHRAVAAAVHLQKIGGSEKTAGAEAEFRTLQEEFQRLRAQLLALPHAPHPKSAKRTRKPRPARQGKNGAKRRR